jgi:hypothetical protein
LALRDATGEKPGTVVSKNRRKSNGAKFERRDIGHAPKDQSNRRKRLPDYAVWEIHPIYKLTPLP